MVSNQSDTPGPDPNWRKWRPPWVRRPVSAGHVFVDSPVKRPNDPQLKARDWLADTPYQAVYGSHVPVLAALPGLTKISSCVEMGPGIFSTRILLSEYPHLTKLISYESDPRWKEALLARYGQDKRWQLLMRREREVNRIPRCDLLVVDSDHILARRPIVTRNKDRATIVLIHDTEHQVGPDFPFKYQITFESQYVAPFTTVCSDVIDVRGLIDLVDANRRDYWCWT